MMARFRDSSAHDFAQSISAAEGPEQTSVVDRSIGDIIAETRNLSAD